MTISVVLTFGVDPIPQGLTYRLTVVDARLTDKIALIRTLRNFTGADLRSSKLAIETLQSSGAVLFEADLGWEPTLAAVRQFVDLGVHLTKEIEEEVDPYDIEGQRRLRQTKLMEAIPQMDQRQDPACEQLADLLIVAQKLGMYDAADVLKLWLESVDKAKEPPHYYAPIG